MANSMQTVNANIPSQVTVITLGRDRKETIAEGKPVNCSLDGLQRQTRVPRLEQDNFQEELYPMN